MMTEKLTLPEAISALQKLTLEQPDKAAKLRPLLDRLAQEHRRAESAKPPQGANIHVGQLADIEDDMQAYPAEVIAEALGIDLEDVQRAIADLLADRQ
jgi:cytochrome P450